MTNYPTALSLNIILLFITALPSMGGELIVNWVRDTPNWDKRVSGYSKNPNFKSIGIDPAKIVSTYDYQRAMVAYLKTKKIKVSIHNQSAHVFLKQLVGGRFSWPISHGIDLSICLRDRPSWIEDKFPLKYHEEVNLTPDQRLRKKLRNYEIKGLKATEGEWRGKVCRDPWSVYTASKMMKTKGFVVHNSEFAPKTTNSKQDYIIKRFFDDWDHFWNKMESKAKDKGFKTLDSFIVDEYSGYCLEKFGQPFWFHLSPLHLKSLSDSRTGPFKKLSYYAKLNIENHNTTEGGRQEMNRFSWYKENVAKPHYESSDPQSWATRWNYIMWNIKWILIFEVWENSDLGNEVRKGRFQDLIKDKESGYPYRVSFDFEGTLEEFILHSVSMYNGKSQNVYLTYGSNVLNGNMDGITIHL